MPFLAVSACWACGKLFTYDPDRVPSIVVEDVRRPLCLPCVDWANALREGTGEALIYPLPGAYGPDAE